jgi:hypothetical protein
VGNRADVLSAKLQLDAFGVSVALAFLRCVEGPIKADAMMRLMTVWVMGGTVDWGELLRVPFC